MERGDLAMTVRLRQRIVELPGTAPAMIMVLITEFGLLVNFIFASPKPAEAAAIGVAMLLALIAGYAFTRFDGAVGTLGPALISIVLIAYVRDLTGGSDSGSSPLFMIPAIWLALYASTRQALVGIAAATTALFSPVFIVGTSRYEGAGDARRALSFVLVALIIVVISRWLRRELLTDPLTRTGNRRSWDREIAREMARAARSSEPLVVAIIDLDRFKEYNDRHGHVAGDRHLADCARAWRDALREEDTLVRAGGEEFFLILPRTSADEAATVLDRVRTRTPHDETCSIGHAVWDGRESDRRLLHRADQALYRAKTAGRNRVLAATAADAAPA